MKDEETYDDDDVYDDDVYDDRCSLSEPITIVLDSPEETEAILKRTGYKPTPSFSDGKWRHLGKTITKEEAEKIYHDLGRECPSEEWFIKRDNNEN